MTPNMERGARIIIHEWVKVRAWDKVLIVTSKEYLAEAKAMEKEASGKARSVNTLLVENKGRHVGIFFDDNEAVFDPYTAIIAATEYSLVTTKAAKRAIQRHKKFLSLPLATNDGRSFLEYDFLTMDTKKSRLMAKAFIKYLKYSEKVRVTTPAGTDLECDNEPGRDYVTADGFVRKNDIKMFPGQISWSPNFESVNGVLVVDGTLSPPIGALQGPVKFYIEKGYIKKIEGGRDAENF